MRIFLIIKYECYFLNFQFLYFILVIKSEGFYKHYNNFYFNNFYNKFLIIIMSLRVH